MGFPKVPLRPSRAQSGAFLQSSSSSVAPSPAWAASHSSAASAPHVVVFLGLRAPTLCGQTSPYQVQP